VPAGAGTGCSWYKSQPAGVVTIMTEFGRDRFDLPVVPPGTAPDAADAAMVSAADADKSSASELLGSIRRPG